jgi:RNA polymerase sigma factor (sigma-70 family)
VPVAGTLVRRPSALFQRLARAISFLRYLRFGMNPQELFEANLPVIERVIGRVCGKAGLMGADAEDFASEARLVILENDCAILRQWEGRSALGTYLTVIVQRFLADERVRAYGKWHPSAEARRIGEAAVTLERLVHRQGRSIDEALPHARALDPALTREAACALLDRLPKRSERPRLVALDAGAEVPSARDAADARAVDSDAERLARRTSTVMRGTIEAMPLEDRMIVRLRFGSSMTIADVARMLRLPQRPLYRRIEAIIGSLRRALRDAAIEPGDVEELIGSPAGVMDFGIGKSGDASLTKDPAGEPMP